MRATMRSALLCTLFPGLWQSWQNCRKIYSRKPENSEILFIQTPDSLDINGNIQGDPSDYKPVGKWFLISFKFLCAWSQVSYKNSGWISRSYSLENCILQICIFTVQHFATSMSEASHNKQKYRLRSLTFKFGQCFACSPIWNIYFSPQWFVVWKLFFLTNRNAMYYIPDYCERLFWEKYVTALHHGKSSSRTGQDFAAAAGG